jgi:hypothetical protein
MKSLVLFVTGSLIFAAAAFGIGNLVGGAETLVQGGAAFALTFVPAAITLAWVVISYRSDPSMMLLASLGASGIRMAVALGGAFFLTQAYPDEFATPFWLWLVLFYPVILALEITLLVRQGPKLDGAPKV